MVTYRHHGPPQDEMIHWPLRGASARKLVWYALGAVCVDYAPTEGALGRRACSNSAIGNKILLGPHGYGVTKTNYIFLEIHVLCQL